MEVRWTSAADDESMIQQLYDLLEHGEEIATQHDMLHPFIYMNYAAVHQDVYGHLRDKGMLEELKVIRNKYDPFGYFEDHLSSPFKLGK